MVAFTVDESLDSNVLYKIMFISQLASGFVSTALTMQPCCAPRRWQVSLN